MATPAGRARRSRRSTVPVARRPSCWAVPGAAHQPGTPSCWGPPPAPRTEPSTCRTAASPAGRSRRLRPAGRWAAQRSSRSGRVRRLPGTLRRACRMGRRTGRGTSRRAATATARWSRSRLLVIRDAKVPADREVHAVALHDRVGGPADCVGVAVDRDIAAEDVESPVLLGVRAEVDAVDAEAVGLVEQRPVRPVRGQRDLTDSAGTPSQLADPLGVDYIPPAGSLGSQFARPVALGGPNSAEFLSGRNR
jgi:hypothetical protein